MYYRTGGDLTPLARILLNDIEVVEAEGKVNQACCFELKTSERSYFMRADNHKEMEEWMMAIQSSRDSRPQGYCSILGGVFGSAWTERYLVIDHRELFVYRSPSDQKPMQVVSLTDCYVTEAEGRTARTCSFELLTPSKAYFLQARTRTDMENWIAAIRNVYPALHALKIPEKRGHLQKLGIHGYWSSRFFSLCKTHLYYYTKAEVCSLYLSIFVDS